MTGLRATVHRMRERFGESLRAEVTGLLSGDGDVEGELTHLLNALEA